MPAQPTGPDPRTEGAAPPAPVRLLRLERLLGLREPEEHGPVVWALLALLAVGMLLLAVSSAFASPPPPGTAPYQLPLVGLFVALLAQGTGDFFYPRDRRLSAVLRVAARLVVLPATIVVCAAAQYLAGDARFAVFVGGFGCLLYAFCLFLVRASGPRRPRGPGPL